VRASIEAGAALAGTLQTANIGIEKIICNIVSNPNIRYLVVCGRELEWYGSGDALKKLVENGIDERRFIIGSKSLSPHLFNIPLEAISRLRRQVIVLDLIGETSTEAVQRAVWSCYQEEPVEFGGYKLYDPGAYPEPPLSVRITWRITDFWSIMRLFRFTLKPRF